MGVNAFACKVLPFCLFLIAGEAATLAQTILPPESLIEVEDELSLSLTSQANDSDSTKEESEGLDDDLASNQSPIIPLNFEELAQTEPLTQSDAGSSDPLHVPVQTMEPVPLSRPTPFQIGPGTPPVSNSPNFYPGNPPVQDISDLLPGKFNNTKYKWYGFVRMDAIFDFNPIGSTDSFVTSSIPVPQGRGQNTSLTPRYTRLGFDTETPWNATGWSVKTRIEIDFFNGNTSGSFGSFPPRLRFAWVDFGPFLIGQAASLFMDYDAFPNVLDYQGPPGMVLMRQPIAAVRFPVGERLKLSAGVEQPYSDIQWFDGAGWVMNPGTGVITTPGVAKNIQDMPDFTGNVRYAGDYGHLQLAGIARKLTYQSAVGSDLNAFGYGANLTGTWHPWACWQGVKASDAKTLMEKSRLLGQYAAGNGINRYIQEENGLGLDATFDPINGFRTIPALGWFVAYEQWWAEDVASNFTLGGAAKSELTNTLPADTLMKSTYYSANLVWFPVERMGVGFEYLYGTRENKDGASGAAHRLQAAFQYKF